MAATCSTIFPNHRLAAFPHGCAQVAAPASWACGRARRGAPVRATAAAAGKEEEEGPELVLVDKADANKVHRLKTAYLERIVPILKEEFGYTNVHQVPKVKKVVVNCGIGDAHQNSKGLEVAMKDLAMITGQRPVKTRANGSISAFKVRKGNTVGIAVTLRGHMMYHFLDRLINIALPRTPDFLGANPNSFDGNGNYNIGFTDQSAFPEVTYEGGSKKRGMDVCINTTAKTDKEAERLIVLLGIPFGLGPGEQKVDDAYILAKYMSTE